jgi:hypothetical protein
MQEAIRKINDRSNDRFTFCIELINEFSLKNIAELGVYRGDFAKELLEKSTSIEEYTMIDPWRNLSKWNKPANKDNNTFEEFYLETMQKTDFAKEKRKVLRGKTTEVINDIKDNSLDFIYIDGDHTLKGITIDLINLWPKVKENGFIVGDDFCPSIWQHSPKFEPTLIFPFAVYFAEAVNTKIYGLPHSQFLITKDQSGFGFIDLTNGEYADPELRKQFLNSPKSISKRIFNQLPYANKIAGVIKNKRS